jgi:arginase family enzyme
LPEKLRRLVDGRPVYVHIDCDVLEPGVVPTEYLVPGGLSLAEMRQAAEVLAESEIIGIEVAEFEAVSQTDNNAESASLLLHALEPIFEALPVSSVS